jgi:chemotaxis protein methyltransferase CheR
VRSSAPGVPQASAEPVGRRLARDDFTYVAEMLRRRTSIVLEAGKEYLVEARLVRLARDCGLETVGDFVAKLRVDRDGPWHERAADALTTNETSFFRDDTPYAALQRRVFPALAERRPRGRPLQIWSAACSTGQEPYSIMMCASDTPRLLAEYGVKVTATDICAEVLRQAEGGFYDDVDLRRGIDPFRRDRHFVREDGRWRVREELRRAVTFRRMNLAGAWPAMGPFDVVFMRNVLIYFDADTKREIFRKIRGVLAPDGYLALGGSESTFSLDDALRPAGADLPGYFVLRDRD